MDELTEYERDLREDENPFYIYDVAQDTDNINCDAAHDTVESRM